jgi:hypothetical protein
MGFFHVRQQKPCLLTILSILAAEPVFVIRSAA